MKTQCQILKESVGALMRLILFRALLCVFALPCALWARELFEPGQVIVRYKTIQECGTGDTKGSVRIHSSASLERLDRQFGLLKAENPRQVRQAVVAERKGSVPASNAVQWRVLTFSAKSDARAIAAAYAKDPAVAYAEPNYIGTLGHVPTDPAYSGKQQTHFAQMKLEQAWDIQQGDPSVIVAVIDSGVDINHPDLAGAIAPGGWDFVNATSDITDLLGHGTRVAGIIAASENGEGGVGAAFGCRILPFAVGNDRGQVLLSDLVAAIEEAVAQGAKVINLSLSFRFRSQLLDEAVAAAAKSAVVVAGVGNDGQGDSPRYPASCPQVLGVGAVDQDGGCAIFSNFNGGELTLVDLVAPGVEVYSPTPGGGWNAASGTSFSTPFVSAVAALLRAYQPEQSPEAIMRHLKKTASRQSEFGKHGAFWSHRSRVFRWGMGSWFDYDREQGDGLVNPYAALATPMIPVLSVRAVSVVDDPLFSATNDGDGELDQSEKVRLRLEITCEENDALNLALRLSCTDERIALVDNAGEPVPEIQVSRSALRCGETAALAFSYIEVAPTAGRGEVPFSLAASDRDGALPDLAFNIMIENKVPVSGPKPDIHFTNDYAYIVEDDLTLSGVCLIDPGTPFSVHPGKKITLSAGGSLTAVGEAEAPILFRSIYDIPDLSLVPATQDGPIAGLSDPHNVGLLGGMTVEELEAQCGPKTVQVNLGDYHQIRHVSANTGSDTTGNGSSANPWQSIQYGLEQILDADTSNRYALFVAEGTYSNTKATTGTAVVIMKEWVDLWGGFDPSSWTRDIEAHVSIIDGSGDNPHRCVNGADNARIDGFTITGGHVTDGDDSHTLLDRGGGICCHSASPTISNNIITGNSAAGFAGGIYCDNASPTISNNTISGNSAIGGGGIECYSASATISNNIISGNSANSGGGISSQGSNSGSFTISNNIISGNSAMNSGGIEWVNASPMISNNIISENAAVRNGGGISSQGSNSGSFTISNNIISGNSAGLYGGGILDEGYSAFLDTISNNIISGNSAGLDGGGICCKGPSFTISNNIISGNSAGLGGGINCNNIGGSYYLISNNIISGNSATYGGGIYCNHAYPTISNNIITGNSATSGGGIKCYSIQNFCPISNNIITGNSATSGGGIHCEHYASPTISNNIITGNSATSDGGIYCESPRFPTILNSIIRDNTGPGGQIIYGGMGTPVASYNNISDAWLGEGENNVDMEPGFVGVIASGTVSGMVFDSATSQTTLTISGTGLTDRDLTGWVVQVGDDLNAPASCSYAPILANNGNTLIVAGDATRRGSTVFTTPADWQIYNYRLHPDSPMKGLGAGPGNPTYGTNVSLFDGDGQPRIGTKCEIGPDEVEWETDFADSVWDIFEVENGANVNFQHVRFENGSGVVLNGTAPGGIENTTFFQQYGYGLDASGGTLASLKNVEATANWGTGMIAPDAAVEDSTFLRNRGTGLAAASALNSQSHQNRGHGFDLSLSGENLVADNNTTDGIRAATILNSITRGNDGWGIVGDATDSDAQNNAAGGIWGTAVRSRSIGNSGSGIQDGAQAIRCEVRDNAGVGILNVAQVEDCTVSGNDGAGISGATQVVNSSSADNTGAGAVGGVFFDTTLSGNLGAGVENPERLSHCTVSRNAGEGIAGTDGTATVNNTLVSWNRGAGLVNLASVNASNILGNEGYAALDTIGGAGGPRDFTGNYWGVFNTDELTTSTEGSNLSFLQDALDGSGAWTLDVWPYAPVTVPEAPRVGGPPYAWRVTPNLSRVTTLGQVEFTLTYTASMDTTVEPSVTFGLEHPYQLHVVEPNPGWITPTVWKGRHAIGFQTGDGINTIRISGAMASDGFPIPDDTSHRFYINTRDPFIANNGIATAIGCSAMHCSWEGPQEGKYNILMSISDPLNFQRANPAILHTTEYMVENLSPQTLHFFKVQRVEADGTAEDWSLFFAWTPAEVPPSSVSMTLDAEVLDCSTGKAIGGAQISLAAETTGQAVTGTDGRASVTVQAIPQTACTLTVTHPNYAMATRLYTTAGSISDQVLLAPGSQALGGMTIHGTVTNAGDGLPAANARVHAQGETFGETLTNSEGAYSLGVSAEPGGFVSVTAVSEDGMMWDSAMLPAISGSMEANLALIGGLRFASVDDIMAYELDTITIPLSLSGEAGSVITLSSRGLPSGAVLDQENRRVEWATQIGDAGTYNVTLFADSDDERRCFVEFLITIEEAETFTITYDPQGGTTPSPPNNLVHLYSVYGILPSTSRTGYTFNGWFTASSGGMQVTPETIVNRAENHTLYAQWTANEYTVIFSAQGGTAPIPQNKQVTYNSTYGALALTLRAGFHFKGWFTAPIGGTRVTSATVVKTASHHTLYAQWNSSQDPITAAQKQWMCYE